MKNRVTSLFWRRWVFALLFIAAAGIKPAMAELVLTAPPRETAQAGQELYGPLAAYLSQLLGEKVVYHHPHSWLSYQRGIRNDEYDIVFDGPHFVSWRMAHLGHEVLVKLPGTLGFYIIVGADDNEIRSVNDLIGKKVCGIPPPNLSSLAMLDQFRNPARQPNLKGIKGGMGKVFKAFEEGKCKAAVLRSVYFDKKLSDAQRKATRILLKIPPLPNQAISVSKRVGAEARKKIIDSLTGENPPKAAEGIIRRFAGKNAKSFVRATQAEYQGHNMLLEGVVFGW